MTASRDGHVEVVNMLLQHGARVELFSHLYTAEIQPDIAIT